MIRESQKDSLKRRVQVYPSWYYRKLVVAYSFMKQQSLGDTVEDANKSFFDSLSDDEKEKLLSIYEGLSEAERTHPKRARPKRFDD